MRLACEGPISFLPGLGSFRAPFRFEVPLRFLSGFRVSVHGHGSIGSIRHPFVRRFRALT